jgi:hypothetical protein
MKSMYYISLATVLFFTGCEFFSNNQELTDPPEFEYLIQDLDNELDLDTEQRSSARSSLERGRDFHPDPATLWELAVELQQSLTQEQRDLLLSRNKQIDSQMLTEENDHHHRRLEHFQRMDDRIIYIMTEEQLPLYQQIIDTKSTLINNIVLRYQNEELERKTMRIELMSVMEWFRAEIAILLTAEQQNILFMERDERDRNWRRGRGGWGRFSQDPDELKRAKQGALKLTGDQITILETSHSNVKMTLDNLRDSYVDGISDMSGEDFRLSVIFIVQSGIFEREQVFTELQQEIIDIHRALVLRFMRHTRWGRT